LFIVGVDPEYSGDPFLGEFLVAFLFMMKMIVDDFLGGCDCLCLCLALEECEVEVPLDEEDIEEDEGEYEGE
jgi:hypothetical protein